MEEDKLVNESFDYAEEGKLSDQLVGKGEKPKLSPNPAFSKFTKQVDYFDVDFEDLIGGGLYIDLSDTTYYDPKPADPDHVEWLHIEPNMLFVFHAADGSIQYWTVNNPSAQSVSTPLENAVRVYPEYPAKGAALKDGGRETPHNVVTAPKKRPIPFTDPVAFHDDVFYKGKLLEELLGGEGGSGDDSNVYRFQEGQVLTEEIYSKIKAGDIILVNQMAFIVAKPNMTPHTLLGNYVYVANGGMTAVNLDWAVGDALELTVVPAPEGGTKLYLHDMEITANGVDTYFVFCISTERYPVGNADDFYSILADYISLQGPDNETLIKDERGGLWTNVNGTLVLYMYESELDITDHVTEL